MSWARRLWLLCVAGLALGGCVGPPINFNALALGAGAPAGPLAVALAPPAELDALRRADVLALRRQAVERHPDLLAAPYRPAWTVFGQMQDGRPWWGIAGQFYYGKGERSIEGPAEEARFILNPYLLVAAELTGLSIWGSGETALVWDSGRISAADLARPDFPFYCPPANLRWQPATRRAEVTYDVTAYLAAVNRWTRRALTLRDATFALFAYNARDMNLNYLWLSPAESHRVRGPAESAGPAALRQYIHTGSSCGVTGGCNNMSPHMPELEDLRIEALPAQAVVRLWRSRPADTSTEADLTWTIHFR
jgi:hypothetical protein